MQNNANNPSVPGLSRKPGTDQNPYIQVAPDSGLQHISQAHGFDSGLDTQAQIHPHLRTPHTPSLATDMMQRGASSNSEETGPATGSPTTTMAAQGIISHEPEHDEEVTDGRKAKTRELSSSKRAAQNRAAQRAFRQRKEHYIKKLEQQVREYGEMEQHLNAVKNDNYALREYIIQLQSRLLDLQVEPPQPPPNVNIQHAPSNAQRHPAHTATPVEPPATTTSAGTLADVAAAVAGLRAGEANYSKSTFKSEFKGENGGAPHGPEEIRRPLQSEGLPPPSSLRA
ncbi:hypothetical protein F5Y16DRAFT_262384 [Xylariaceae sp. FL0255]|nr:hypothetical protein F5Y16DRAFT_262384 [Xylariaceae sp. FL0255]